MKILSFLFMIHYFVSSLFGLSPRGYEAKELLADSNFSNGFYVLSKDVVNNDNIKLGKFQYENTDTPSWMIAQWGGGPCLWNDRIDTDKNILTDGSSRKVEYSYDDKSLSMRLDGSAVYNGESAGLDNFPHLLLEQSPFNICDSAKDFYSCTSKRIVYSMDIRLSEYIPTTNAEGINAVQYLAYFYIKSNDNKNFVWFGLNLYDDRGLQNTYWSRDTAGSTNMIYSVSTKETFGNKFRTLNYKGVSDKWTHIAVDLTPHIDSLFKKLNEDNTFDEKASKDDYYIGGMNIGFEVHGNACCTVDIKNLSLMSYR